jgi:hypothetical protein
MIGKWLSKELNCLSGHATPRSRGRSSPNVHLCPAHHKQHSLVLSRGIFSFGSKWRCFFVRPPILQAFFGIASDKAVNFQFPAFYAVKVGGARIILKSSRRRDPLVAMRFVGVPDTALTPDVFKPLYFPRALSVRGGRALALASPPLAARVQCRCAPRRELRAAAPKACHGRARRVRTTSAARSYRRAWAGYPPCLF